MKVISPILGYTLKTLYQPLEVFTKYRQLVLNPHIHNVKSLTNISYGPHSEQVLDIFQPKTNGQDKQTDTTSPVVIYVHGGSFVAGDKSLCSAVCRKIASYGYLVFNINYRLAPKYTYGDQVQDIAQAAHWIYQQADRYKGQNERLFLMGDTTGANLISTYSTALAHPYLRSALGLKTLVPTKTLKGLLLLYGVYDLDHGIFAHLPLMRYWHAMLFGQSHDDLYEEWIPLASPIRYLHYQLPPIFIAAGEADPLFSQSTLLANRLKDMEHPYATAFFDREQHPHSQHVLFNLQFKKCSQMILSECLMFLHLQSQLFTKNQQSNRILELTTAP